jgi:hypothetical protein
MARRRSLRSSRFSRTVPRSPTVPHQDRRLDSVARPRLGLGYTPGTHPNGRSRVRDGIGSIAARAVLWFLAAHRGSRIITTAPTFEQVRDLLWTQIRAAVTAAPAGLYPDADLTRLEISDEWFAVGLSTNTPERFAGHHARPRLFRHVPSLGRRRRAARVCDRLRGGRSCQGRSRVRRVTPGGARSRDAWFSNDPH